MELMHTEIKSSESRRQKSVILTGSRLHIIEELSSRSAALPNYRYLVTFFFTFQIAIIGTTTERTEGAIQLQQGGTRSCHITVV